MYRHGVHHLTLCDSNTTPTPDVLRSLANNYPNLQTVVAKCQLGGIEITVKSSQCPMNDISDKVLVEVSSIKDVDDPGWIFPGWVRYEHTRLPTIDSDDTQLHIINCGRDESLPYINLQCMEDPDLLHLLLRLAPPRLLAVVGQPYKNVVDLRCLVAGVAGEELYQICEMMLQLKRLHIVIHIFDDAGFGYYEHLSMLTQLESLGIWIQNFEMPEYPAMPIDLASHLCSLDIEWDVMAYDIENAERIFTNLEKLVVWFRFGEEYEDMDPEDIFQAIDPLIPPQCQVQFRYTVELAEWPVDRALLDWEERTLIDSIPQWEAYIANKRQVGAREVEEVEEAEEAV
jgi:hypothetical protein